MSTRHWKELLALGMIGDGIVSLLAPRGHYKLWSSGPGWQCHCLDAFIQRPHLIRAIGALELLAGLWLAKEQMPHEPTD